VATLSDRVAHWIRPEVRALTAYHVPDPGDAIKLDAMENPYGWDEALMSEWLAALRQVSINRYPDPGARALKRRLREAMRIPAGMDVLLGNGSDELIQMLALAVSGAGRSVLAPEPTFVMYRLIAQVAGMDYVGVPLARENFSLDLDAMLAAVEAHRPALIFLAYPNNPTGNLFDAEAVRRIIEAAPGLVVVDEAYAAFARDTFMEALTAHDNLLLLRTVSKMGLAGLRLGLLVGRSEWLAEIDKTRLPYNVNTLTQASADFALQHRAVLDAQTARIRADREALFDALRRMDGIEPFPSEANFILFRTPEGQADRIFAGLLERGVLIKNLNPAGGLLADCLRVTVGTPAENRAFLDALKDAVGGAVPGL